MKIVKLSLGLICLLILASNVMMMARWTEARGVYDDVCYLRQAHLFQRFGIGGLDTNAARDDDGFFKEKLKEIGFRNWSDPTRWPCHNPMPGNKVVMQYPPGTGFLLALFPQGHQVVPLYAAASLIVCGFALLGVYLGRTLSTTVGAGMVGAVAILLMISPSKASYSMAPTMTVCALVGFLTALWMAGERRNLLLTVLIGLLLGLSVNFRLPNLFLAAGYFLFLGVSFLRLPQRAAFVQGVGFGVALVVGMLPTLIANALNAGSPFATTYGGVDVVAPEFNLTVLSEYLRDVQLLLIVLAAGSVVAQLRTGAVGPRRTAAVVGGNLLVNLAFFLSHPIFTPYYMIPIAMLSLWSLSFAVLMAPAEPAAHAASQREPGSLEAVAQ